jgi:hypothetical protein
MQHIDYWQVIRRWSILIVAGTVLAALVGFGVARQDQWGARRLYQGSATVTVNDVTPPGMANGSTLSVRTQMDLLSGHVSDPNALHYVAAQAHVALPQVQTVITTIDPDKPIISVTVLGYRPGAMEKIAQGMANHLAGVQTKHVQAQAHSISNAAAFDVRQSRNRWLAAGKHYYLVCGCVPGPHHPKASVTTLARLRAELDVLRLNYEAAFSQYLVVRWNPVPVATVSAGASTPVTTEQASVLEAVLSAALIGLFLSFGLAALLDYRRIRPPAEGSLVHATVSATNQLGAVGQLQHGDPTNRGSSS